MCLENVACVKCNLVFGFHSVAFSQQLLVILCGYTHYSLVPVRCYLKHREIFYLTFISLKEVIINW